MKKFKFGILFFIWLIFTTELILRTAYYENFKTRSLEPDWINDSLIGYLPMPKTVFTLNIKNVNREIAVNQYGFYGNGMRLRKQNDYYRIAVVGNSCETGHFSESNKSYIELCNDMFMSNNQRIECIDFSIDDQKSDYLKIQLIREKILKFEPDLVILNVSMPLRNQKIAREFYNGVIIDYELHDQKSALQLKKYIDSLNTIKIFTKLYDFSFLFRSICIGYIETPKRIEYRNEKFWRKMEIYITKKLSDEHINCYSYSKAESDYLITNLNNELKAIGISLLILKNSSFEHYQLPEGVNTLKLNTYTDDKIHFSRYGNYLNKKGTKMVALELYNFLINSSIPSSYLKTDE